MKYRTKLKVRFALETAGAFVLIALVSWVILPWGAMIALGAAHHQEDWIPAPGFGVCVLLRLAALCFTQEVDDD